MGLFISPQGILSLIVFLSLIPQVIQGSEPNSLRVDLTADKAVYASGEPIILTLRVINDTSEPVRLSFGTSQRFDFLVRDQQDEEVWRWSKGRFFAQMLGREVLKPFAGELVYRATLEKKIPPGVYKFKGIVPVMGGAMSAALTVSIQQ